MLFGGTGAYHPMTSAYEGAISTLMTREEEIALYIKSLKEDNDNFWSLPYHDISDEFRGYYQTLFEAALSDALSYTQTKRKRLERIVNRLKIRLNYLRRNHRNSIRQSHNLLFRINDDEEALITSNQNEHYVKTINKTVCADQGVGPYTKSKRHEQRRTFNRQTHRNTRIKDQSPLQ